MEIKELKDLTRCKYNIRNMNKDNLNLLNKIQGYSICYIEILETFGIGILLKIIESDINTGFLLTSTQFISTALTNHIKKNKILISDSEKWNIEWNLNVYYNYKKNLFKINTKNKNRYIQDFSDINIDIYIFEIIIEDNINDEYYFRYYNHDIYDINFFNKEIKIMSYLDKENFIIENGNIKKIIIDTERIKNLIYNKFKYNSISNLIVQGSPIFIIENNNLYLIGIHHGVSKILNSVKQGLYINTVIDSLINKFNYDSLYYEVGKYIGNIKANKQEGYGKLIYNDNYKYYIGYWNKGNKNGKGIMYKKLEDSYNNKILYYGEFHENYATGNGIKYFKDNYYYTGEMLEGYCNGNGILYDKNGKIIYQGQFSYDKFHGFGKKYYNKGEYYIGNFVYSLRYGKGKFYYESGQQKYIGFFINDEMHGKGKYFYRDGRYYFGNFKNNKFNGFGILYNKLNKVIYYGYFKNDLYSGYGIKYYNSGNYYKGTFKNGKIEGIGTLYDKLDNIIYQGNFSNDLFNEYGLLVLTDNYKFIGNFINGLINKGGLIITPDNKILFTGYYENNKLISNATFYEIKNKVIFKGNITNGKRHGCGEFYDRNNKLLCEIYYLNGIPIEINLKI